MSKHANKRKAEREEREAETSCVKMDDVKLILEVEKYSELYQPQHPFYKDNTKKDKCWEAVATAIESTSKYTLLFKSKGLPQVLCKSKCPLHC